MGEGHRQIVKALAARVAAVAGGDTELPRIVLLEGASGLGKSRIVRELYREMCTSLDHQKYWPAIDEWGGVDAQSSDPLPGRKRIGPDVEHFVWPAGVLPGFAWWQLQCERMQGGELVDVAAQARAQIAAHLVPIALASREAASLKEKAAAKRGDLATATREALSEGGIEAATRVLASFDVVIPGLGLAAKWAVRGVARIKDHFDERGNLSADVDVGHRADEQRRSVSAELSGLLRGVAHREVPAVVVIEDLHLMGGALAELLDLLSVADAAHPVVVIGSAWPQSNVSTPYTQWRSSAATSGRVQVVAVQYLEQTDLVELVRAYAPNTSDEAAAEVADQFPNPLSLEVTLSDRKLQNRIAENGGALPQGALSARSTKLKHVYRHQFWQLSAQVQVALAAAAGAAPAPGSRVWPFVRGVVAEAAQQCPELEAGATDVIAGIEHAAEDNVWLVPSGVADSFREALQAQVAYEHFQEVLADGESTTFRDTVAEVLVARVDAARGEGYSLDPSEESRILSRWLLAIESPRDSRGAHLAAAFHEAQDLARTYQLRAAINMLAPRLQSDPSSTSRHIAVMRTELADWYEQLGLNAEALATLDAIEVDERRIMGANHVVTLEIQHRRALALRAAGRIEDAISAYEVLIPHLVEVLGDSHALTGISRNGLAVVLSDAGRFHEAIPVYQRLLETLIADRGSEWRGALAVRQNLASAYGEVGQAEKAVSELEKVLCGYLATLGPRHIDTLAIRHNLAGAIAKAGRIDDAIAAYQQLLADKLETVGEDHVSTFWTRHMLAQVLPEAGRIDEAIIAFDELLEDRTLSMGVDHPTKMRVRSNLARALRASGRTSQAIATLEGLLRDQRRVLGPDHPDTLKTQSHLDSLRQSEPNPEIPQ